MSIAFTIILYLVIVQFLQDGFKNYVTITI